MTDFRESIYSLEGDFLDWNRATLTLKQCRAVVEAACALYGLDPPRVTHHPGKGMSFTQFNNKHDLTEGAVISFNYADKNRAIALHESAHYITDRLRPALDVHHGREWLDLYCWLLLKFEILPRPALFAALKHHGLRGVEPARMSPKKVVGGEPWKLTAKELRKL